MNRKTRFLVGLLLLVLAPLVVIGLFAAYAYWDNTRPQSGALQTRVKPVAVLPWSGESSYYIEFNGQKAEATPAPPAPLDVAFIVDVSGSMTASLPAMATAATEVLRDLVATRPGLINFALIRFDTEAQIDTNWTGDPQQLYPGLNNTVGFTGGTDPRRAFEEFDKLLANSRPQAKKAVVFYTDGIFGGMSDDEIIAKSQQLRQSGVDIFSVGVPEGGSAGIIYLMTDNPKRVFNPTNVKDLAANFRFLADGLVPSMGDGGELANPIDGQHFSTPLQDTGWAADGRGNVTLDIPRLPEVPTTYAHPLVGHSAGLWRVGAEPATLVFTDQDSHLQKLTATHRPALLVVTWFMLFFMLLPALLWVLFHIPVRPPAVASVAEPWPEVPRPRLPVRLPALPRLPDDREAPIPTLFIGLGGTGRRVLQAMRGDLKQAHLAHDGQPYRFLWLDLDTREEKGKPFFDDWPAYPIEQLIAPPEVRHAQAYIPEIGKVPEPLQWFDVYPYQNVPKSKLNLAEGTRGDRALARLALFEWLARKGELLPMLGRQCQELLGMLSIDGTRQIVVVASADGGTGSGWFLDIGRLLRRFVRQQQAQGAEFVPEIVGVLCESADAAHPENQKALEMEIESAKMVGGFPERVTYVQGEPLLDQTDTESPYNWLFKTSDTDANSSAGQSAELAAVLVERHPRAALLEQTAAIREGHLITTISQGLHVLPTLAYELVRYQLFLRIVGPDTLLDIEPTATGGFAPRKVSEEDAAKQLREWAQTEPAGTPWQMLLAAAANVNLLPGLLQTIQAPSAPHEEWFGNAFSASLTRRLHGHADADQMGWHRDWMPGDAVATLRLLADRLRRELRTAVQIKAPNGAAVALLDYVAGLTDTAADEMERWLQDCCRVCEEVSQQSRHFSQLKERLRQLRRRTYIDQETTPEQVEQWAKASLEQWLGTRDTISLIRERLFFSALVEGASTRVFVRSCIEKVQDFSTADELAAALDGYTRSLAYLVPAVRIEGALSELPEARRRSLARSLVNAQTSPRQVLLVAPRTAGRNDNEPRTLDVFINQDVVQPPNHGLRRDQRGDDHSAVRRMEMLEAASVSDAFSQPSLPLIETAERAAELVRLRAEKKHRMTIPTFPVPLRIAMAHPDSFRSFVRAYQAGHIGQARDAAGRLQWVFLDTAEFLTFSAGQTLATAAANYVWYVKTQPQTFTSLAPEGSFNKLQEWLKRRNYPDEDTLTQLVIDIYES